MHLPFIQNVDARRVLRLPVLYIVHARNNARSSDPVRIICVTATPVSLSARYRRAPSGVIEPVNTNFVMKLQFENAGKLDHRSVQVEDGNTVATVGHDQVVLAGVILPHDPWAHLV